MRTVAKLVAVTATSLVASMGVMPAAQADNSIIHIGKYGDRSASHRIAYVKTTVTCSEDTVDARLTATLTQVTSGGTQVATGQVTSLGAFECSGEEEIVWLPVRRPTGGFKWVAGSARVSNFEFVTTDPSGTFTDTAKGRTIMVR